MILDLFSLVIQYLLKLALRKSSKASLALVLNAGIAVAVLEADGNWIVIILQGGYENINLFQSN